MLNHNITFEISEKIKSASLDFSLFEGCKSILVALSGGADSCCLLLCLVQMSKEFGFSVSALHVNHGIRGKEADRDENFARDLCKKQGIAFYCEKADIPSLSKQQGVSQELCARNLRYSLFEQYCEKYGFDCVAVAHNACDNAETILFNLSRGTSLKGLCGIPPKRPLGEKAFIIRPLIYVTREQIEEYLESCNQSFVTDSSNLTNDYTRNFLRNEIIPRLREINPSLEQAMLRTSVLLGNDSLYLENETIKNETNQVSVLCEMDRCILSRIIRNMFTRVCSLMPEQKHIDALCHKIYSYRENPSLRCSISFPGKMKAYIENGILSFRQDVRNKNQTKNYNILLKEGINIIDGTDFAILLSFDIKQQFPQIITHNNEIIYKKYTTDCLYSDKIPFVSFARNRQEKDVIFTCGMNKSLKRLMCLKKIPAQDRMSIPIICKENGDIILVPGTAVNDLFSKPSDQKRAFCIVLYRR